jgi:sugar lactone lactonase YvrE
MAIPTLESWASRKRSPIGRSGVVGKLVIAGTLCLVLAAGSRVTPNSRVATASAQREAERSSQPCTRIKQVVHSGSKQQTKTFCLLQNPGYATVDGSGNVYVTVGAQYNKPTERAGIVKFSPSGIVLGAFGSHGTGRGQFINPLGIAVDRYGNMFVSDATLNRIQKVSSTGKVLAVFGRPGAGHGQFAYPGGMALDSQGHLWIVDSFNARIQEFTDHGQFLRTCCSASPGFNGSLEPSDVKVDAEGNIYVTDHQSARVLKFSPTGRFLARSRSFGNIASIAVDRRNNLYLGASGDPTRPGTLLVPKLSPTLKLTTYLPSPSPDDAVAVDREGNLYLVDNEGGNRVVKTAPDGTQLAVWR